MQKTLKTYQKRLTNLSAKNKALFLPRIYKSQFIDLQDFHMLEGYPAYDIIIQLIKGFKQIPLAPVADSRDASANKVSKQLWNIRRTENIVFEESGSHNMYVGYPFVKGKLMNDTSVRCPLLLFPVSLEVKNNWWVLKRRRDIDITFNKSLLLAISHYNNVTFDDQFLDLDFDELSTDSLSFLTELYRIIEESSLELHFNQETFGEFLHTFESMKKEDIDGQFGTGQLKLFSEAVLGIFPLSGSYLMPDYDTLINNDTIEDLDNFFTHHDDFFSDPDLKTTFERKAQQEEELLAPYDLDASQENILKQVKSGDSLVVQGPPGSGKSQLICNIIADFVGRGKKVLVASQKRAALDVVYDRLKESGLEKFTAIVHDHKDDRRNAYRKILRQLESLQEYIEENNGLDAIQMERTFLRSSREIDQIIEQLDEYKEALFNNDDCGLSAKELYLLCNFEQPHMNLRGYYQYFPLSDYHMLEQKFRQYVGYYHKYNSTEHPWCDRINFKDFKSEDLNPMLQTIESIRPFFKKLVHDIKDLVEVEVTLEDCEWLLNRESELIQMLLLLQDVTVYNYFKYIIKHKDGNLLWLKTSRNVVNNTFGIDGVEKNLHRRELPDWLEKVAKAEKRQKSWFERIKWRLFSKDRSNVDGLMEKNNLDPKNPVSFSILTRKIENRMNLEHQLSTLFNKEWLTDIPTDLEKDTIDDWFHNQIKAMEARVIYTNLRTGIKFLDFNLLSYDELFKIIEFIMNKVKELPNIKLEWMQYLSKIQIDHLLNDELYEEKLLHSLKESFEYLVVFDQFTADLGGYEHEVFDLIIDECESSTESKVIPFFFNSMHTSWLYHIESKYPILKMVSNGELERQELQLQTLIEEKQNTCKEMVMLRAKEGTYENVAYNRLNNMVTYRDLRHQASKKRSIWPLRKVIHHFQHELLDLLPCWIASPESISAIFPLEKQFDVVIFDEASQCFAEKGIPAMYRGKQVVIMGDDQQLQPYDLYQPRWEEDETEENVALEAVSLLDLGKHYLPEKSLTGHYRSEAMELIHFSNQEFYDGKLRFLPNYDTINIKEKAIDYIHVKEGVWEKGSNQAEAAKVAFLTTRLIEKGETSIGIITFNYKQQEMIQDLFHSEGISLPESVFIKNIENVQGDERDIIIFSTTYAPSISGRMTANFGLLNVLGGEKRLNVAITRAKKKICIVSSILPSELDVEHTKNDGPKLLKKYLQFAYEVSNQITISALPLTKKGYDSKTFLRSHLDQIPQDNGVSMTNELPFSDLAVTSKDNFLGLIYTDDHIYHQSTSVKDFHAYRHFYLKSKKWPFKTFYSREWWRHPEESSKQVNQFTARLMADFQEEDSSSE